MAFLGDKNMVFGDLLANLIIGNVGHVLSTPFLLSEKFTFLENDIKLFEVEDNNVYAHISNNSYDTVGSIFANTTDISFLEETDGFLKKLYVSDFNNSPIESINCKGVSEVHQSCFWYAQYLSATNIILPNVSVINSSSFLGLKANSGTLNLPNVDTIASTVTSAFQVLWAIHGVGVNINLEGLLNIEHRLSSNLFAYNSNNIINIPNCVTIGLPSIDTGAFYLIGANVTINCNLFLATNNNDGEDADIAYARSRGAIINFI